MECESREEFYDCVAVYGSPLEVKEAVSNSYFKKSKKKDTKK
jgi:hypothetical protein